MKIDLQSSNLRLRANADLSFESPENWYGSYGAHVSTENCGDVDVQSVEWDWLDDDTDADTWRDEALVALTEPSEEQINEINQWHRRADGSYAALKVKEALPKIDWAEIESLVSLAKRVREAAEGVCESLKAAVAAYKANDLDGVLENLRSASSDENDHGDNPATMALAGRLLEEIPEEEDEPATALEISRKAEDIAGCIWEDHDRVGTLAEQLIAAANWVNRGSDGDLTDADRASLLELASLAEALEPITAEVAA